MFKQGRISLNKSLTLELINFQQMKKLAAIFLLFVLCDLGRAQNDTLLYLGLTDILLLDADLSPNPALTTEAELSGWKMFSDERTISAELTNGEENSIWYEEGLWKGWHKIPYIDVLDTTFVGTDSIKVDTTNNFGLRAFSWYQTPNKANNLLLSPDVFISDNMAKLTWRSMPLQGPRHQDGYKVFVLEGGGLNAGDVQVGVLNPDFEMQSMDVTNGSPSQAITSLSFLQNNFPFLPVSGTPHTRYTLPDTNEFGNVDSTRQQPFMQEFELDLSGYSGFIQVAFYHDAYDNNGIILDDILITGNGSVGVEEELSQSINVFPNPVRNQLHIRNTNPGLVTSYELFSLAGKLITTYPGGIKTVDVSTVQQGSYLLVARTVNGTIQKKITKIN